MCCAESRALGERGRGQIRSYFVTIPNVPSSAPRQKHGGVSFGSNAWMCVTIVLSMHRLDLRSSCLDACMCTSESTYACKTLLGLCVNNPNQPYMCDVLSVTQCLNSEVQHDLLLSMAIEHGHQFYRSDKIRHLPVMLCFENRSLHLDSGLCGWMTSRSKLSFSKVRFATFMETGHRSRHEHDPRKQKRWSDL